jgi:predicted ATPase
LSDVDAPTVAMICRRLDGIALAIELAGGRAGSLGIRGIAELLDNRFSMLWHGRRTALPRHQTLNAMLDWSYNLLPDHEKAVFRRLSVFVRDFTIEAACAVASGTDLDEARVAETIQSLLGKSLLSTSQVVGSVLNRLLDTTRAYARAKLDEREEVAHVARLHAEFYFSSFSKATRSSAQGSVSTIYPYTHHTSATCVRRWSGPCPIAAIRPLERLLLRRRRRFCSAYLCWKSAGASAKGPWPLSTIPAIARERR